MSGDEQQNGSGSSPMTKSKRKSFLAVGSSLIIVAAISGLLWFLVPVSPDHHRAAQGAASSTNSAVSPVYVETPEMLTNLDAGPHRIAFAKIQYRVEVDRPADASLVTAAMPRIVDMTETYLRAVKPEELRSDTGAYLLREALLGRLAVAAPGAAVSDILFEELLIQ